MISMTTAPNATVRIKEGDLVEKEEPSFTWKNEKENLSLRSFTMTNWTRFADNRVVVGDHLAR
jgi:hypothetical protein